MFAGLLGKNFRQNKILPFNYVVVLAARVQYHFMGFFIYSHTVQGFSLCYVIVGILYIRQGGGLYRKKTSQGMSTCGTCRQVPMYVLPAQILILSLLQVGYSEAVSFSRAENHGGPDMLQESEKKYLWLELCVQYIVDAYIGR